ncbi:MAG: DivIVA domain-containing protein [Actinomycetota bacterium]|nr:DivIVA domain-containing protein [Actinomycetota bacterium]
MQKTQEIGREFFGYKKDDIDKLLAELHHSLRVKTEENSRLKEELKEMSAKLASYEKISNSLKNTMLNAEKTASEIIQQARSQANMIIARASKQASEIVGEAQSKREALESGYKSLQKAEQELDAKVKSLLNTYVKLVESIDQNSVNGSKNGGLDVKPAISNLTDVKKEAFVLPENSKELIQKSISRLGDIRGVDLVWAFDSSGNTISSNDRFDLDLHAISSTLAMLCEWTNQLEETLAGENANLLFIEFSKLFLAINPINQHLALGIISSTKTSAAQILQALDVESSNLKASIS